MAEVVAREAPLPSRAERGTWEGRAARRREAPSTDRGWASILRRGAPIASFVAVVCCAAPGRTQPGEAETVAMTEQARKLFKEGVAAFKQSRWAEARAAFLTALALNGHYTILGNLAAAELKLGRYRDATAHLARCVREMEEDATSTAEERARGEAAYAEARAKVGALVLHTNVDGARVFVDSTWQGVMPLADPLFVEPGAHTISVEREDYETKKTTVQFGAGGTLEHRMPMERRPAGTPAPKAPETTAAPAPALREGADDGGPRPEVLIAGGAVAGAGVIAGVVLTALAVGRGGDADTQRETVVRDDGPAACAVETPRCAVLRETLEGAADLKNAALWTFVGAGAVGLATGAYALWAPRAPRPAVMAAPVVTAGGGALVIRGAW
ncbi:PEGA domain-containing protein [Sorangium sp. So ce448]|uniref:PEGA domain-containing protein n=1 Tax=Sorangium sp. So ce448 TaxID=3133314 RepID=UPI003F5D7BD9